MKRPIPVTLTIWLVLTITVWNALRAWTALAWSGILKEYAVRIPPELSAAIGMLWFIIGSTLFWALLQNKAWAPNLLIGTAAGYIIWQWVERIVWQNVQPDLWFNIIQNLICLILIFFAWRSLLREAYERNIEHPKTE